MATGDDWNKLVQSMREMNRVSYEEVLGKVLGESCKQNFQESMLTVDGASGEGLEAVDPTQFYKHLERYTSTLADLHMNISPITTSQMGDAATVFRSLLQAIEHSLTKETERVNSLCEIIEIETWNNESTSDANQRDREMKRYNRLKRLRRILSKVSSAMGEWRGNLSSRIVGTATFEGLTTSAEKAEGIQILTTKRRTKKDGGIERIIPVPFAVPVVRRQLQTQPQGSNEPVENRQYYQSLTEALYSVTIKPNPIRGYDWRGLMKRGEVIQETFIRKVDVDGNDIAKSSQEKKSKDDKLDNFPQEQVHLDGMSVVKAKEKQSSDTVSVCSRDIGIQATDWREMDGDVILIPRGAKVENKITDGEQTDADVDGLKQAKAYSSEAADETQVWQDSIKSAFASVSKSKQVKTETVEAKASQDPSPDSAAVEQETVEPADEAETEKDMPSKKPNLVGENALYAAAVAAISVSRVNRRRRHKILPKISTQKENQVRNNESSPGTGALSGMKVGDARFELIVDDGSEGPLRLSSSLGPLEIPHHLPTPNLSGSVKSHLSSGSDSVEQSTVDSKVSGVKDSDGDESSMTHSSAIDTPSDIDDLSLGSFTDSSEDGLEKEQEVPTITVLDDEPEQVASCKEPIDSSDRVIDLSERSNTVAVTEVMAHNQSSGNISDMLDSECTSSSTSSSDDSSTSSSSSSTSSSSDSSASSESLSSSSDENLSNNISESAIPSSPEATTPSNSNTDANKIEWVTRKETRFCHPLPHSLIFHLKRFEYSNTLGRVENLSGEMGIPVELDLKPCCSNLPDYSTKLKACCYHYCLNGAIVHVEPTNEEAEKVYGEVTEGHYVTFIKTSDFHKSSGLNNNQWFEMDDDKVHIVDEPTCNIVQEVDNSSAKSLSGNQLALKILSGCNVVSFTEESQPDRERKCATLVVYSRTCDCHTQQRVLSDS